MTEEVYKTTLKEKVIRFLTSESPLLITATLFSLVAIYSNNYLALLALVILARHYIRKEGKNNEKNIPKMAEIHTEESSNIQDIQRPN